MPLYRWDVMEAEDFRWLRERARRSADLYAGYRVDHVVGFYRTYGRLKHGGDGFFTPPDETSQLALGERLVELFRGAGAEITAEDLGTVPDVVRASLARLGVAGYRVFRWERHWHTPGQPFRDPTEYPKTSVATSGTHDTEPVAVWWDGASEEERRKVSDLPAIQRLSGGADLAHAAFDAAIRDVLLEALFGSASDLLLLPVQDAFGWRDRINEPAIVNEQNWTFRLPWAVDKLDEIPEAGERKDQLRAWSEKYGRVMADG
jgi:4-alpha-glucanotransferase